MNPLATAPPRRRISLHRRLAATLDEVWALWTTPAGIEAWWGPPGFDVVVHALDLVPGGQLRYDMRAVGEGQRAFMERAGMPTVTHHGITFVAVEAPNRLVYRHPVDFVPGVAAYDVETVLELAARDGGVDFQLTIEAMHDDTWTSRAVQGWEGELGKLNAVLRARRA